MDIELEKKLKEKYPLLYVDLHNTTPQRSCMYWGIECGSGWYAIIDELSSKLEPIVEKWMAEHPDCEWPPRVQQAKEKFGTLRFYHSVPGDGVDDYVNEAEARSETTCEECGKPGTLTTKGWMYVACEECREKRMKR